MHQTAQTRKKAMPEPDTGSCHFKADPAMPTSDVAEIREILREIRADLKEFNQWIEHRIATMDHRPGHKSRPLDRK